MNNWHIWLYGTSTFEVNGVRSLLEDEGGCVHIARQWEPPQGHYDMEILAMSDGPVNGWFRRLNMHHLRTPPDGRLRVLLTPEKLCRLNIFRGGCIVMNGELTCSALRMNILRLVREKRKSSMRI